MKNEANRIRETSLGHLDEKLQTLMHYVSERNLYEAHLQQLNLNTLTIIVDN